jgi:hypothetical protein
MARSVAYYRTKAGKFKKKLQNGKRAIGGSAPSTSTAHCDMTPAKAPQDLKAPSNAELDTAQCAAAAAPPSDRPREPAHVPDFVHAPDDANASAGAILEAAQSVVETPPQFNARLVAYVRTVAGLIEGRSVSRKEIVLMLARVVRQHRMARERRMDYVLCYLNERPP